MSGAEHLTVAELADAWDDDPTMTLLRSTSARWVLPLFSQYLEFATGPVSADWFHAKVAEAREEFPEWASETSPTEYCKRWVDASWLVRTRARDDAATIRYRLSPHSLRALRLVRGLIESQNTVSEARLGSISDAIRKLADMADPSREAQLGRIDEQIAALQQRRSEVAAGKVRAATADELKHQLREVLQLTSSLPEDFRQLGVMVEQRHREVARSASAENVGKGEVVEAYLREHDLLDQTPEGRAYRGFAQAMTSQAMEALRADVDQVLRQPFARRSLSERQRVQLESLVTSLLVEEHAVQETYLRWTASLRRFLTRSVDGRHQRLLSLADEAVQAGIDWAVAQPGAVKVDGVLEAIGAGGVDVRDMSQMQLWRDPGPREISVVVETHADLLPDADRAALRLASGTSAAAITSTLNDLLATTDAVTGHDLYAATPMEFRRLATLLTVLDLGVVHGTVDGEATEAVTLITEAGDELTVALPRVVFDAPVLSPTQEANA